MTARSAPRARQQMNGLAAALLRSPWAITDEGKEMLAQAARTPMPDLAALQAIEKERGSRLEMTDGVTIRDGIATIRIVGPLFRYDNDYSWWFGWSTYEGIARDITMCRQNPNVRRILGDFDTPGGEVNGCAETARLLFSGRDEKQQDGYASGLCCSAGLWLATAFGKLSANETAIIGSLGVMCTFYDDREFLKMVGLERHEVRAKQSQKKNRDADLQATIDSLGAVFVASVAEFKGVAPDEVMARYGQGLVFVGAEAVTAGLADELTTYEALHAQLAASEVPVAIVAAGTPAAPANAGGRPTTSALERPMKAKTEPKPGGAPAPGAVAEEDPVNEPAPVVEPEKKKDEGTDEEKAEKSASAERARVKGIMALQRSPSEATLITACIDDPKCSIADAALKLRNAEGTAGTKKLDGLRAEEKVTPAPAAGASGNAEASEVERLSESIANAGPKFAAKAAS